ADDLKMREAAHHSGLGALRTFRTGATVPLNKVALKTLQIHAPRENAMQIRSLLLASAAAVAMTISAGGSQALAQSLTGQVSSGEEGAMEGVVVSAKKAGSTITVSVVSDAQGHFSFPSNKIEPGQYALRIRAAGYELDGPKTVEVGASGAP